jgi:hypothetical protein
MTDTLEKLGKRVVACKHWRWMPGMAVMRKDTDDIFDEISGMSFVITEVRVTAAAFGVCDALLLPQHRFVEVSTLLNDKTRSVGSMFTKDLLPDLSDPATLGCLLALAREAWGAGFHLVPDGGWLARGARLPNKSTVNLGVCAPTEAEALVAVLEAAQ